MRRAMSQVAAASCSTRSRTSPLAIDSPSKSSVRA